MARKVKKRVRKKRKPQRPWRGWVRMKTPRLLDVRIRDLELRLEGTWVHRCITKVQGELERRGLRFRPYFWISDDWFTPDGYTGVAIPFYLLHPRLARLERSRMGFADGSTRDRCLRILRHEVGHAIDHAHGLHRRRRWQRLFGASSRRYPRYYQPNPYSKRYVQHLEYWYAQSHPDEDFAETFAVWLAQPRAWRTKYKGWPALRKLEYVDELMEDIAGEWPETRTRNVVEPASRMFATLRDYYRDKRRKQDTSWPNNYDRDLLQLFTDRERYRDREAASSFIRRVRAQVVKELSPWIGEHRYHLGLVLQEMIGRCQEKKLRAVGTDLRLKRSLIILLAKYTTDALYRRPGWIEL